MKFLLPHRFKKTGAMIAPMGFCLWLVMQLGYMKSILANLIGLPFMSYEYHTATASLTILGFFSFLSGLYFIAFSKEKTEDEMVESIRLQSFQFAAFLQLVVTVLGFLLLLLAGEPGKEGIMLFFILLVLLFWLSFIVRFNFIIHMKYK